MDLILSSHLHMYNNDIIPEFNYNDFDKVAEYPVIQSIFMLIFIIFFSIIHNLYIYIYIINKNKI